MVIVHRVKVRPEALTWMRDWFARWLGLNEHERRLVIPECRHRNLLRFGQVMSGVGGGSFLIHDDEAPGHHTAVWLLYHIAASEGYTPLTALKGLKKLKKKLKELKRLKRGTENQ